MAKKNCICFTVLPRVMVVAILCYQKKYFAPVGRGVIYCNGFRTFILFFFIHHFYSRINLKKKDTSKIKIFFFKRFCSITTSVSLSAMKEALIFKKYLSVKAWGEVLKMDTEKARWQQTALVLSQLPKALSITRYKHAYNQWQYSYK